MKRYLLGDICKVYSGVDLKDSDYRKSGIPVLKSSEVSGGFISEDVVFYCDPEKALNGNLVRFGDVVITRMGGKCRVGINLTNVDYLPISTIFKLDPNPEIVSREYLYYCLLNSLQEINSHIANGNVSKLYKSSLLKVALSIPDLETQARIVEYLNQLQELRKELELRKRQGVYYRSKIMNNLKECASTRK
ncbi:type I restriction enzyme specificity HsdS domain protein [Mycoplasma haemofelis Ohio2]|uniref:Type I restriction enzyme specificity HsdS domain protein n=1 Tax=Mycoplasma haemofelis (strain Ohio2) TaxID=859194 RepID=F6FIJ6_MYCHI|nr:type I restriction enzyme specificity HsdS domain protein [Mycoplasma haemofelis Ohio2]